MFWRDLLTVENRLLAIVALADVEDLSLPLSCCATFLPPPLSINHLFNMRLSDFVPRRLSQSVEPRRPPAGWVRTKRRVDGGRKDRERTGPFLSTGRLRLLLET